MSDVTLKPIPRDKYEDFRYEVIFEGCKWDPQVGDANTIADEVVVLNPTTAERLCQWAESLAKETVMLEEALLKAPSLYKELDLPRSLQKALREAHSYNPSDHVRLMRFDFHPTMTGWAVSEVNSDVPGGFAESSVLPKLASRLFTGLRPHGDLAEAIAQGFESLLKGQGRIGLVHATSYSDDRQVVEFLSRHLRDKGFSTVIIAPDHVEWNGCKATSIAQGQEGALDGLLRFFPAEWLGDLPRSSQWVKYFASNLPACNHPAAILTQSKRLPLVWDKLKVDVPTWREMLPETVDPRCVDLKQQEWILKPAFGRVGEDVSIREVVSQREWKRIFWDAKLFPRDWVAQRRFNSLPLKSADSTDRHLCIGVFTVRGKAAGFYGRISSYPRIDSGAKDIAVLVSDEGGI